MPPAKLLLRGRMVTVVFGLAASSAAHAGVGNPMASNASRYLQCGHGALVAECVKMLHDSSTSILGSLLLWRPEISGVSSAERLSPAQQHDGDRHLRHLFD
jgi:hypothetical protein